MVVWKLALWGLASRVAMAVRSGAAESALGVYKWPVSFDLEKVPRRQKMTLEGTERSLTGCLRKKRRLSGA